jgi:hypothetical protein
VKYNKNKNEINYELYENEHKMKYEPHKPFYATSGRLLAAQAAYCSA